MAKYSAQFPFFYLNWLMNHECRLVDLTKHFDVRRETISDWNSKLRDDYGIIVESRTKSGKYRISEDSLDIIKNNSVINWMLNTISLMDTFKSKEALRDRIALEEIPSSKNLHLILEAMENNQLINFDYIKYFNNPELKPKRHELVEPYCVKLFERRWYVISHTDEKKDENDNGMRTFSLDQISNLQVMKTTFEMPKDFNAKDYFEDFYGIITGDNGDFQTIEVKVDTKRRANYFRALPLHHSQEELLEKSNKEYAFFTFKLRPSEDFYQALLHHGEYVEVLSPPEVREKLAEKARKMAEKYNT